MDQSKFIKPTYGPDVLARQLQMMQDSERAKAQIEHGMQPLQGQMVSGHYIAPHWSQQLAQGLNRYQGERTMQQLPEQMAELQNMQQQQMLGQFGFGQPSPQQLAQGLSGEQPQGGMAQGPMLIPGLNEQQSMAVLSSVGPEEYSKLMARAAMQRGTSAMQNAEALGLQPGTPEYNAYIERVTGSPQTVVNVGGDSAPGLGRLSSDYGYVLDPETRQPVIDPATGLPQAAPVPGSPAAQEQADAASRAEAAKRNAASYARTVTQDIGIADSYLDDIAASGDNVASASAREASSRIPGTAAYNMKQFVDSALSNVTLDTMNRMRETSQAGATGFGNMSERQMEVIRGVLGQWKPGLPIEDQRMILHRLGNFYLDVQLGSAEERAEAVRDGRMSKEENDAISELYYPETRDIRGRPINSQNRTAPAGTSGRQQRPALADIFGG